MNDKKRKKLSRAINLLKQAYDIVDGVVDEESDDMDNMPENLQTSERYDKMESAIDKLEEALEQIEAAQDTITEASA